MIHRRRPDHWQHPNYWRDARREMRRRLTPDVLRDALSLVMEEPPPIGRLTELTRDQRVVAWEWAMREHFSAGDVVCRRRQRPVYL